MYNAGLRAEAREQKFREAERLQKQKLRAVELSKDADSKERVKIIQDFRKCQQELTNMLNDVAQLTNLNLIKEEEKVVLQVKLEAIESENEKLHLLADKKEADYVLLKEETTIKIDDLMYQIKQLNEEYHNKENTIDELRDNVNGKKVWIYSCVFTILYALL
jgi:HD-GYP domain-containing protein (c-di-GMP phosphodiesterase class II)